MDNCRIPLEILHGIISHIPGPEDLVAIPAFDTDTRTLHSCLFVCKAIYSSSLEQLYRRCLYVDSAWRLRALLRSYEGNTPIFGRNIEPQQFRVANGTAMYLSPFSSDTIGEGPVVDNLSRLFGLLSNSIRRLVVDMPLRSYLPSETSSQNLRSVLRGAFLKLKTVEEFTSVRDELYLSTTMPSDYFAEPPVWSTWNNLRKLALYNLDVVLMHEFLKIMPNLEVVVLTRPDTEDDVEPLSRHWNSSLQIIVVNTWRDHSEPYRPSPYNPDPSLRHHINSKATSHRLTRPSLPEDSRTLPAVDVICVDGQDPVKQPRSVPLVNHLNSGREIAATRNRGNNWAAYDLRNTFNDIRFCQLWVRQSALIGELWIGKSDHWTSTIEDGKE